LEGLQQLIRNGANVNEKDREKYTPLHLASRHGHIDIVRELIRCGASVHERDMDGTPLHTASRYGHVDIVRELIKSGAHVNEKDRCGWTSLHIASRYGSIEVTRELIRHGICVTEKTGGHTCGWTALHLVIYRSDDRSSNNRSVCLDMIRILIESGVDAVNERDYSGSTPLHIASSSGDLDLVQHLVHYSNLSIRNNDGRTALEVARGAEVRKFLIDYEQLSEVKDPGCD
jgi:ankyrin repeat protein